MVALAAACTAKSTDGPIETCADDPDCWKAGYESLLNSADFLAFETLEVEECTVTVTFAEENPLPPIQNVPMYVVSRSRDAQTSFEQGARVVLFNNAREGLQNFAGGLVGITKYIENEGRDTRTTVNCATREYSTEDNVWVITRMKEKPSSGMTGSSRIEGSQRPWQDLIELALENAPGERHLGRVDFGYFYPPSQDGDGW